MGTDQDAAREVVPPWSPFVMLILGITDGQTSGAAILDDARVLAAVSEERLVRMKQALGFPRASIREVFRLAGVSPQQIEAVAVAQIDMHLNLEVKAWKGWFEERGEGRRVGDRFFAVASRFGWLVPRVPGLRRLYYGIRGPYYRDRRRKIVEILAEEHGLEVPVRFYHHHLCHAASAYYSSGYDEACVVTMDGGGDRDSSHVYHGHDGRLDELSRTSAYDSLGNYYAYITAICGYKAKKHEGKITGLAAHGEPRYLELLRGMIRHDEGRTRNVGKVLFGAAVEKIERQLPRDWKKEDLACSIQQLSEEIATAYVRHWVRHTGASKVALAGGIFANVRINQEIGRLAEVDDVFVFPGMSDEGLSVGAAMAHYGAERAAREQAYRPEKLEHVFFGNAYGGDEIERALADSGLAYERSDNIARDVAALLADGYIVCRFDGAMEFGPRALGNRSILYTPTDRSVNDWLNVNLRRTEFMPFAPAVLADHAERCFLDVDCGRHSAEFMTITYHCTEWMRQHCEGVVHVDDTARPQLVREDLHPSFYRLIDEFRKLTGLPCVINTSFNMHEEPIVCTPADAIRAFEAGNLDYLAIGDCLVKSPSELTHEPRAVGSRTTLA